MTTALSNEGTITLPAALLEELGFRPGDCFDVSIEDEDGISLRRVTGTPNQGLVDLLTRCPGPFEIVDRDSESQRRLQG